jgi:DNA invertase Pin-like site-specific DNA recombinase
VLAIFSWVAEQERTRLVERTKAGLARVREHGSRSGRPIGRPRRLDAKTVAAVRCLAGEGRSGRQIAVALKVPRSTVRRALAPVAPVRALAFSVGIRERRPCNQFAADLLALI